MPLPHARRLLYILTLVSAEADTKKLLNRTFASALKDSHIKDDIISEEVC